MPSIPRNMAVKLTMATMSWVEILISMKQSAFSLQFWNVWPIHSKEKKRPGVNNACALRIVTEETNIKGYSRLLRHQAVPAQMMFNCIHFLPF